MRQNKILTAIDGSIHSIAVLDKAIEYARLLDGEIILLYCHKRFPKILGEPYKDKAITDILLEAENLIKPYLQTLKDSGVSYTERLMEEPAGSVIPNVADIEKCKLIVMGSRGLTDLEGLIIGSVTHRVLHLANCPVLVIK